MLSVLRHDKHYDNREITSFEELRMTGQVPEQGGLSCKSS
jgi:hypothetical protein